MQTFKINPAAFKELRKKMIASMIPISIGMIVIVYFIGDINKAFDLTSLFISVPIIAVALISGLYRGMKRQKALLDSYELIITNNMIIREQLNTSGIGIYFKDIKAITKHKKGGITINGKDSSEVIIIPPQIEDYARLENTLQDIHPITLQTRVSFARRFQIALTFIGLGLMICVYSINNKIIVAITGTAFIGLMLWSFIKVLKSKNIDSRTKRGMWWILLVLASVIYIMVIKIASVR